MDREHKEPKRISNVLEFAFTVYGKEAEKELKRMTKQADTINRKWLEETSDANVVRLSNGTHVRVLGNPDEAMEIAKSVNGTYLTEK